MKEYDIPRYIDSQQQFLFWELDEFCVCSGLFMIGIMADALTIMCIASGARGERDAKVIRHRSSVRTT